MPLVVITGAAGNIGTKLRAHFATTGWAVRGFDTSASPGVDAADLLAEGPWTGTLAGADAVIHLAGHASQFCTWAQAQENMDMTANLLRAARREGARRVVFASSNWVMAGYRFAEGPITPDLAPHPVNAYGASKLAGERMGRDAAAQGLQFLAFRIGYNQRPPNVPGAHMDMGRWGQQMWLSDRDLCQAFERAVLAEDVGFAVLNLMSDNPGMRWDIAPTRRAIGYAPRDGWTAVVDATTSRAESLAARARQLATDVEDYLRLTRT
jgi:UDP-glucose 4-epimerase